MKREYIILAVVIFAVWYFNKRKNTVVTSYPSKDGLGPGIPSKIAQAPVSFI